VGGSIGRAECAGLDEYGLATVPLAAMTSACVFWRSLRYVAAPTLFVLTLAGPAWQNSGGQQASGAAAVQAQPAQAGSPTDPKPQDRVPLPVPKDANLPTLFLVGDSTVRNGRGNGGGGQWGWGEPLVDDFNAAKINVVDRAIGGLSSRTYMNGPGGGPWAATLAMIKPGDVVLIQFGHNDGDCVFPDSSEKVMRNKDNLAGWAQQVAEQEHVGFLDLNEAIARHYDGLGEAAVEPLFGDPHTHIGRAGAELNAEVVVSCLKALKNNPVAGDLSAKGDAVRPYKE